MFLILQNELVSVSGKAIVRLDDLIDWVCTDVRWTRGCNAICEKDIKSDAQSTANDQQQMALFAQNSGMNISDISKEKQIMGEKSKTITFGFFFLRNVTVRSCVVIASLDFWQYLNAGRPPYKIKFAQLSFAVYICIALKQSKGFKNQRCKFPLTITLERVCFFACLNSVNYSL